MIRVGALIWSLLAALLITALSLFYNQNGLNGYPLSITYYEQADGHVLESGHEASAEAAPEKPQKHFSWTTFFADAIFWWIIFSILLVVVKNYVFDSYQEKPKKHIEQVPEKHGGQKEKEEIR